MSRQIHPDTPVKLYPSRPPDHPYEPNTVEEPSQPTKPSFFTPGSAALTKLLAWVVAILLCVAMWLFFIIAAHGHTGAPGGKSLPGRPALGKSVLLDPGPSETRELFFRHISDFQIVSSDKLNLRMSSSQARMHGMGNVTQNILWGGFSAYSYIINNMISIATNNCSDQNNIWCLLHNEQMFVSKTIHFSVSLPIHKRATRTGSYLASFPSGLHTIIGT